MLLSLAAGVISLLVTVPMKDMYMAKTVITPSAEKGKPIPALGALASLGITSGPTKIEDLENLFKSRDLTVRVFKIYNLWPVVLPERFDPRTGKQKGTWLDSLFGKETQGRTLGDWDAIRVSNKLLKVAANKRVGTLSISFESPSPEGSAIILKNYLDEAKSSLQEEALERAMKNKKFIEAQIARTVDTISRERMYLLYSQEVEREMLARNREQFGFRIVDSPRIPDRKVRPKRARTAILITLLSCCFWIFLFTLQGERINSGQRTE